MFKIMKISISKENNGSVCVVVDYVETQFSNFAIEYLRENEKSRETPFACSYGAQVKKLPNISWHCPFEIQTFSTKHDIPPIYRTQYS